LAEVLGEQIVFPACMVTEERNVVAKLDTTTTQTDARIAPFEGRLDTLTWMLGAIATVDSRTVIRLLMY